MVAQLTWYERFVELIDRVRWALWLQFHNGSGQLQAAYEAVDDVGDCLNAIESAVMDGDGDEAIKLIHLSREAIAGHIKTLKELL